MNALKAIEVINAAAELQEEANDITDDIFMIGISLSAGSCQERKEVQVLYGIEKLAAELNIELLDQEETKQRNKEKYFIHRGVRIFQIDD